MIYTVFYKTSSFAGYCFLDKNSIYPKRHDVFSFTPFKTTLVKIQICSFIDYNNCKQELDVLVKYRQPFFDVLKDGYNMTLAEIKSEIAIADENKIPTKKVINQIRDMLETWDYTLIV